MPAFFFVDVHEVTDAAKMQAYRDRVFPIVEKFGGRYRIINGRQDSVEGNLRFTFPVLIEFPSMEQARRWYDSPEYRAILPLRLESTRGGAVFIEGL
jgi:uncharacterized protein (DUF1330 family)